MPIKEVDGVKTPEALTPLPDQVPPEGVPVKVNAEPLLQVVWLAPVLTDKGDIVKAPEFPEFTAGLLATIRSRYPLPEVLPPGIVTEIGLVVPVPIVMGDAKLPDALLSCTEKEFPELNVPEGENGTISVEPGQKVDWVIVPNVMVGLPAPAVEDKLMLSRYK